MEKFVYLLPVLGCAVMMGAMMWMMMRGEKKAAGQPGQDDNATAQQVAALRAEITALRDQTNPPAASTAKNDATMVGGGA